ncbi:MAG: hypothetical protein JSS12_05840 [Verrucomicrobia bacterium]|nr:hypothetical protein [Verrucomicrobiota bacterium]
MAKILSESILRERDIMHHAELSGSILKCLPRFLNTLSKDIKTAPSISAFEKEFKKAEKEHDQNMTKAIEWAKEKIDKLKTSRFSRKLVIKRSIKRMEEALQNTDNLPSAIHLDLIITNLQQAVSNLTAFENDAFFEGWAKTRMPSSQRDPNVKNENCRITGLQYGVLEELLLPNYIKHMLSSKGSKGLQKCRSQRESDPATLLDFLKTLSKYGLCESTAEPNFFRLKCAQDAEELCLQGYPWPYLRQFSSTNPKDHPLSRKQILRLIDTFLNMVEGHIAQQSVKPPSLVATAPKKDARVLDRITAVNWMKSEWLKDTKICQETMVDRLIIAISNGVIKLIRKYKRPTYIKWTREPDPFPIAKKLRRPKSKNRK